MSAAPDPNDPKGTQAAQQPPGQDGGWGPDGTDGSAHGRTIGLASLVLGIGGLLTSPFLIGGIIGIVAIVLGIVAIVLSRRANARVKAAGREPRTGGALGLGVIGIITGIVAVIIPVVLLQTAERVMGACEHLEPGTPEYQRCIADQFENKQDGGPAGGAGDAGAGDAG